jgi:hypothetical protein
MPAQVGDEREAAGWCDAEPGPARPEVAPGDDAARRPFAERRGGAIVELVAIAHRDQPPSGMRLPGDRGYAHFVDFTWRRGRAEKKWIRFRAENAESAKMERASQAVCSFSRKDSKASGFAANACSLRSLRET